MPTALCSIALALLVALHEGEHLAFNTGGRAHLKVGEAETGEAAQKGQSGDHLELDD